MSYKKRKMRNLPNNERSAQKKHHTEHNTVSYTYIQCWIEAELTLLTRGAIDKWQTTLPA